MVFVCEFSKVHLSVWYVMLDELCEREYKRTKPGEKKHDFGMSEMNERFAIF